ncbi:MAG TPA: tRNA pseudouridine(55) synthase TruB [Gallionellaceae bacterium]
MKRAWRALDGVLLFDKPLHLSSNTALQKVRRLFQAEKAGHTGTLDPLATGLLPICFGEATKFSNVLLDASKAYRAWIRLGQRTTTGDAEGEIIAESPVSADQAQVLDVLRRLTGEIDQLPPMHSALKHQGKPLYEYIRKGETVEREPRRVTIHELALEHFAGNELRVTVHCSKGTYVRTLAEDIGQLLGCGAHLQGLRRLATGPFRLENAYTLEQLESMGPEQRDACLLPLDCMLQDFPRLDLDASQVRRLAQGQRLGLDTGLPNGKIRLHGPQGFIGLGFLQGRRLAPERLVAAIARNAAENSL